MIHFAAVPLYYGPNRNPFVDAINNEGCKEQRKPCINLNNNEKDMGKVVQSIKGDSFGKENKIGGSIEEIVEWVIWIVDKLHSYVDVEGENEQVFEEKNEEFRYHVYVLVVGNYESKLYDEGFAFLKLGQPVGFTVF